MANRAHIDGNPAVRLRVAGRTALLPILVLVPTLLSVLPGPAGAVAGRYGRVEGIVVSASTGRPVEGATMTLPALGLQTTSGPTGTFRFDRAIEMDGPWVRVTAEATAPGFGRWSIEGAPVYAGDTLRLNVELRAAPFHHRVLLPSERALRRPERGPASSYGSTCSGWDEQDVPPATISVFVTSDGSNKARRYDFAFYAAHVLPNEWISSWDADALDAGAIAVKTYAWYRSGTGHAYSSGSGCADVIDTVADQIFDPTWSTAATDQAVYATFGSVFHKDGVVFLSQYFAGTKDDPCAPVEGQYAGRMSQWGTQTCATGDPPMIWDDIVTTFYPDGTNWHHLNQLVLNRSFESDPGMYAWLINAGTVITRVEGGAKGGDWYLSLDTTVPNTDGVVRQSRSYDGTTATVYTISLGLRCDPSNAGLCKTTIKLFANPDSGSSVVTTFTVSKQPRDGVWRSYTFEAAPGIVHTSFKLKLISKQVVGIDTVSLKTV